MTENNKQFFNDIIKSNSVKEYDLLNEVRYFTNSYNDKLEDSFDLINNLYDELFLNINTKLNESRNQLNNVINE